jgi:hypothetical protein
MERLGSRAEPQALRMRVQTVISSWQSTTVVAVV